MRLPSTPWRTGEPCSFIWAPGGLHTLRAGFREHDTISITVDVDPDAVAALQESFDHLTATHPKQEPYGDEDHAASKATLRFPQGETLFSWGEIGGTEGVIITGGRPTSYGCEVVLGKVFRSWSPEFTTDADFTAAVSNNGHWTFPDFVRGSESNPAHITGVNFVVGALTNRPAFREMPAVKAKLATDPVTQILESLSRQTEDVNAILDRLAEEGRAQ